MVVWLSCYAFLPVVVVMVYDKINKFFNKCCKKKGAPKDNIQINKEEMEKIKEQEKEKDLDKNNNDIKEDNLKEKKE